MENKCCGVWLCDMYVCSIYGGRVCALVVGCDLVGCVGREWGGCECLCALYGVYIC